MNDGSLIGRRLDEYHILSQLGEGGMSTIYLGLDTSLQRYTAIKVIHAHLKDAPENVARFKREARAVANLDHPNIVRLYRYGQVDDVLYMAMQYIEGVDLRIVLRNYRDDGTLIPVADALRITKEICRALEYAHQRGVLHRDVKPSNIMLNREGTAILTDFGLALLPDVDTQGTAFGTPQYMAPEQAQSPADVGPQSDLYAVGMVLYEMFTGVVPFHEVENPMEMVALRATTPPPPPSTIQSEITPELEAVILKALALNPAERYQSGSELAGALADSLPMVEAVASEINNQQPVAVVPEIYEAPSEPVSESTAVLDQAVSPPTAVPYRPPARERGLSPSRSQRKIAGLPLPVFAVGGCLLLLLLAVLVVGGGSRLLGSLLGDEYQTWLPLTMQNDQEPVPGDAAYPGQPTEPPSLDNAEAGAEQNSSAEEINSEEEDDDREDGEDDENEGEISDNGTSLQIATRGDDSFFLINTGGSAVSLSDFQFSDDKNSFDGSAWGLPSLSPGQCVSIWKDRGSPRAPNVDCNEVGERFEIPPNETFWKKSFNIFFQEDMVFPCSDEGCEFSVPSR